VDALIGRGIKRVFVGMQDPNPLVRGKGISSLEKAGIPVKVGILEGECRALNETFVKFITTGRPFVTLKAGASLDGRIAAVGGEAKWITNARSRQYVHRLRNQVDAVLVGIGTVKQDDPLLTTRLPGRKGKDPIRIVVDSTLKVSPNARVFNPDSNAGTIVATSAGASARKIKRLEQQGAKVIVVPSADKVDLRFLMKALGREQITSVLIEGGSGINTAALEEGVVDKVIFFYAPRILGGRTALPLVAGKGVRRIEDGIVLDRITTRRFGDDVMIEGYVKNKRSKGKGLRGSLE
jgi:diaminohydroxyphosphoribosylaminopyrimidine deaminase/5-amino-6-(5-phosphoribosylamino)uracil reductase